MQNQHVDFGQSLQPATEAAVAVGDTQLYQAIGVAPGQLAVKQQTDPMTEAQAVAGRSNHHLRNRDAY